MGTRATISGTHLGEYMGAKPTGKKVSWTGLIIYRFDDDGKIVERWQDSDALTMLQQLSVIPTPGQDSAQASAPTTSIERNKVLVHSFHEALNA
ncbi:MAG: ester cyclase [Anaerolineae bacterium]